MKIIEEGVVVEKGKRGGVLFGNFLEAISGGGTVTMPEKGYYWAKVKVPSLDKPLKIRSEYNFSKGTRIRVKYHESYPEDAELVVDWK